MSFRATTTATITRGLTTDAYGDPIEADTVVASGVPVSILETGSTARRPVEGRTDNVRAYAMRVPRNLALLRDDLVRDEQTGLRYSVDEVVTPVNPTGHTFPRAVLRRVT